jgi:cardiolipin synthase A/B
MVWGTIYFLSEWVIRLSLLAYVPQRRTPAAARSWLLFIFVLPWPGLILYALIGRPQLSRRRVELQRRVSDAIRLYQDCRPIPPEFQVPSLPAQIEQVAILAHRLGDFRLLGGNRFDLIAEYGEAIDRLVADIDSARDHVHLLYYIFADDPTARRVEDAVSSAAARGVRCAVLIDGLGSKRSLPAVAPRLAAAGVEVRVLLPVGLLRLGTGRFDLRNHRKIAVIDGRIGYAGSQNIVDAGFKVGLTFEELVVRITGPVVAQLQTVFLADRFFEVEASHPRPEDLHRFFPAPAPAPAGQTTALTLPSGPGYPQPNNLRVIVSLIHAAERRVMVTTPYFIPSEALAHALQMAALRGLEVHLVVSAQIDQLLVGLAQRSYYESMLECGVHIHCYRSRFLHAKHISIDDSVALIGSSNMDIRSFALNAEISMLVHDPQVVAELRRIQDRYLAGSDHLELETWRRRPRAQRFLQNIARLADSLL